MVREEKSESSQFVTQASTHPEMSVTKHAKKAVGSRFDRSMKVSRSLAQVATPIIIAVVGSWYNCATAKQHDYQVAVQILNQREQSELQARSAVFEKPMAVLLDKQQGIDTRILTLETFLYNFHGVINARNLLTDLENEIEASGKPGSKQQSKRLQLIAQGVRRAQRQMLTATMNKEIQVHCPAMQDSAPGPSIFHLATNKEIICTFKYPGRWFRKDDVHHVSIVPLCVGTHAQLESECPSPPPSLPVNEFLTSVRIKMATDSKTN